MPDRNDHSPPEDKSTEAAFPPDRAPERIGPYRIVEKIGEGGMGVVYLAEQDAPLRRRVALKVIKPGMDSKQVLARFEAERQALALMNHPGVAKVFDAGSTPEGRPYFVMEHVAGLPITEYCDKHLLDNRQRLELFIQVCEAIQHAHQKGIIHRDIKPSNALVALIDGKPQPKVIDFGVAKATQQRLTEKTLFTQQGVFIGTPEYMSPEQAEMNALDIDTRSDVYSLGVLLYELLTGVLPFDSKTLRRAAFHEIQRIIRETDPPKPSTRVQAIGDSATEIAKRRRTDVHALQRLLRRELDWITMRALEKDRTRRYGSPSELAEDLRRFQLEEPVSAGPPSGPYRVRKFVRRHRLGVAAAVMFGAALVLGIAGTTIGLVRARRAEIAAKAAEAKARTETEASSFLAGMFDLPDPGDARGRAVTAKEIIDRAANGLRSDHTNDPAFRARLLETMGKVYRAMGLYEDAQPLLESAVESRSAAFGEASAEVAATVTTLAGVLIIRGRSEEAIPMLQRAVAIQRTKLAPDDVERARALSNLGNAHRAQGENDMALPFFLEALAIRERALGPDAVDVAKQLVSVGATRLNTGDSDGARRDLERALSIYERKLGPDHLDVARPLDALATQARKSGDPVRAFELLTRVLAIKEKNLGPDHPALVVSLVNLGTVQKLRGDFAQAEGTFERADAIARAKLEPDHRDAVNARLALDDLRKAQAGR